MAEVSKNPPDRSSGRVVLVVGGDGFVGRATCAQLLDDGWAVHLTQRHPPQPGQLSATGVARHDWQGDYPALVGILEAVRPTVIVFLASVFRADHVPEDLAALVDSNIRLGLVVAEAALYCGGIGIVNTGTVWQYGAYEGDPVPVNLYAVTKQNFEDLLHWCHQVRGLSCVTLLLSDTYGPGDTRRKILPLLLDAIGREHTLDVSGGLQQLEFVHVQDVARAFSLACSLLANAQQALWLRYALPGETTDLRGLADLVAAACGKSARLNWGSRPYRAREVMAPVATGLQPLPGWAPRISLQEGLAQLCQTALKAMP